MLEAFWVRNISGLNSESVVSDLIYTVMFMVNFMFLECENRYWGIGILVSGALLHLAQKCPGALER